MATVVFKGMIGGYLERIALSDNEGIICDTPPDGMGARVIETYVWIGNEVIYTYTIVNMIDGRPVTIGGVEQRCPISRLWAVQGQPDWERREF